MLLDHALKKTRFACTLMNEVDDGDTPQEVWLVGNTLIFLVSCDRSLRDEDYDELYFYEVTDKQREILLNWAPGERDISCEWVYVNHEDPNRALLMPDEWAGLDEGEQESYTLELDVSI